MAAKSVTPGTKSVVKPVEVKDTLSGLMEQAKAEEGGFFTGHPAMEANLEESTEDREAREAAEEERQALEDARKNAHEETGITEEESQEQKAAREAKEAEAAKAAEAAGTKVPETEEEKQAAEEEAAEQRVKDAQRKMHETTAEMARVREQNEKLSAQIQELLVSMAKQKTEEPAKEVKPAVVPIETRMENTLEAIEALNPEDPQFRQKSAKIWAKCLQDVAVEKDEEVERRLQEKLDKEKADRDKADRERDTQNSFYGKVEHAAKEAGLDMRTNVDKDEDGMPRNSIDFDLFWRSVNNVHGKTPEEIIEKTIKEVNRIKGVVVKPAITAREKAVATQKKNAVLETGAKGVEQNKKDEPVKPISISDAMALSERRIE